MSGTIGVVLMAYGTPRTLDELDAYYTHIRRGRPPTVEQLDDLRARYEAIGGLSPLTARSEAQRDALQRALDERSAGRFRVELGMKHAAPFIEDTVAQLCGEGADRLVGLVLAPHYSRASVGAYLERAGQAANEHGATLTGIEQWHLLPALIDLQARGVAAARSDLGLAPKATKVFFTAHSLPERALVDDPYPDQLLESASATAAHVDLLPWPDWALAWQSAGRTPEPWRGPDILDVIRTLADTGRAEGVVICPQGFVSDHLEVRYDLDIEARRVADDVGLAFARTPTVDDDPAVLGELADLVVARAEAEGWT